MPKPTQDVATYLAASDHPRKGDIESLRQAILGATDGVTEHIKWNAPSFCYEGDDRVTMRLQPKDCLQLIFHRGAKVKDAAGFVFEDPSGLLTWLAPDRATVVLGDAADVAAKRGAIATLAARWMHATR